MRMSAHPKASLMRTPSDGDVGKYTLFLFRVRLRPFFLRLDWLGGLGYLRYVNHNIYHSTISRFCLQAT